MKRKNRNWILVLAMVLTLTGNSLAQPIFGPAKYERGKGAPEVQSNTFQVCNTGASYRLVIENGAAGKDRVSAATISLNGLEIVRPSDLNQRVERVEKEVSLQGDNVLDVRLTSNPGGFLTVSLFCVSGCLDVAITSPAPGSAVNQARALVQGNILNYDGETGIVLKTVSPEGEAAELAQVRGNLFAGLVPLQTGENTLAAIATDACGYQVRREIIVNADPAQDLIRLSASPDSGVLEVSGIYEVELSVEANLHMSILQYAWDFEGDGEVEQTGSDSNRTSAKYTAPGLYLPAVTVTNAQGSVYKDTAVVLVVSQGEMDALLRGKWDDMRIALINGEVGNTLKYFEGGQKSKYKRALEKLRGKFGEIFNADEQLSFVSSFRDQIEYENLVIEGDKAYSYPIIFIKDENGLWKIRQF